jgi:hypothetical protein
MTITVAPNEASRFNGNFKDLGTVADVPNLIHSMLGVEPELVEDFDLLRLDTDERLQVRLDPNNAPAEMVNRFVHQMSFSQFPPMVVTADDRIVDGNTRRKSYHQRETRFAPVLVIPISYDEADDDTQAKLRLVGLMLNNTNGKPLNREERKILVRDALDVGMTNTQIAGISGFNMNMVASLKREIVGEEVIEDFGIEKEKVQKLSSPQLGAIGQQEDLEEERLEPLVKLAVDANLGSKEIKALGVDVRRASSEDDAKRIVKQAREANAARIKVIEKGGLGKPPAARGLRQKLGFITARNAESMVETNPNEMKEHLSAVKASIDILTQVAKLQEKAIKQDEQKDDNGNGNGNAKTKTVKRRARATAR